MPNTGTAPWIALGDADHERSQHLAAALREAGYMPRLFDSAQAVANALSVGALQACIVHHTLPGWQALIAEAHQAAPPLPVLLLVQADTPLPEDDPQPDDYVLTPIHPALLRRQLERLLAPPAPPEAPGFDLLAALTAQAPLALALCEPDGRLRFASDRFLAIVHALGWRSGRRTAFDIPEVGLLLEDLARGHALRDRQIRLHYPDGHTETYTASGGQVTLPTGEAALALSLYDITPLKQSETDEREQRMLAEALRDSTASLARSLDPRHVLHQLVRNAGGIVPHDAANIMLLQDGELTIRYLHGYPAEISELISSIRYKVSDFPTFTRAIVDHETVIVPDSAAFDAWIPSPGTESMHSYLGTPLRAHGRVIGLLNLNAQAPGAFTPEHADRLRTFTDHAAAALENAQLYEAVYRDAARLRSLNRATSSLLTTRLAGVNQLDSLYDQIALILAQEYPDADCAVLVQETIEQQPLLVQRARAGRYVVDPRFAIAIDAPGPVPHAFRTGQTIVIPGDLLTHTGEADPRTRSEIVVPLRSASRVLGVLDLQSPAVDGFPQEDMRILEIFAERAAAIIENVQLVRDIQQRIDERTTELNQVKRRIETILNHSTDAILLLHTDGRIQQTNNAFDTTFGYAPDQVFQQSLDSIASGEQLSALNDGFLRTVSTALPMRMEVAVRDRTGTPFAADVVFSPVMQHGQVSSILCSLRDVSRYKQLEHELREALHRQQELNDFKSQFISRASHEFRTPLMTIASAADLLRAFSDRMTAEKRAEKLEGIQEQVQHITQMLDELLTVSRAQELAGSDLRLVETDLVQLCETLLAEMRAGIGSRHILQIDAASDEMAISADPRWLRRALSNLLANAIKYSPEGSTIRLWLAADAEGIVIRVCDAGIGIPQADLPHIFEPFYRARNAEQIHGTGLGLSIVQQAAQLHGGRVTVESQEQGGTVFAFYLPAPNARMN